MPQYVTSREGVTFEVCDDIAEVCNVDVTAVIDGSSSKSLQHMIQFLDKYSIDMAIHDYPERTLPYYTKDFVSSMDYTTLLELVLIATAIQFKPLLNVVSHAIASLFINKTSTNEILHIMNIRHHNMQDIVMPIENNNTNNNNNSNNVMVEPRKEVEAPRPTIIEASLQVHETIEEEESEVESEHMESPILPISPTPQSDFVVSTIGQPAIDAESFVASALGPSSAPPPVVVEDDVPPTQQQPEQSANAFSTNEAADTVAAANGSMAESESPVVRFTAESSSSPPPPPPPPRAPVVAAEEQTQPPLTNEPRLQHNATAFFAPPTTTSEEADIAAPTNDLTVESAPESVVSSPPPPPPPRPPVAADDKVRPSPAVDSGAQKADAFFAPPAVTSEAAETIAPPNDSIVESNPESSSSPPTPPPPPPPIATEKEDVTANAFFESSAVSTEEAEDFFTMGANEDMVSVSINDDDDYDSILL